MDGRATEDVLLADHANDSEPSISRETPTKKQRTKTGKRKGKRVVVENESSIIPSIDKRENSGDAGELGEAVYSNGEDAEPEDMGDADPDNASKSAEGCK